MSLDQINLFVKYCSKLDRQELRERTYSTAMGSRAEEKHLTKYLKELT